jgi:hypothetical protein
MPRSFNANPSGYSFRNRQGFFPTRREKAMQQQHRHHDPDYFHEPQPQRRPWLVAVVLICLVFWIVIGGIIAHAF